MIRSIKLESKIINGSFKFGEGKGNLWFEAFLWKKKKNLCLEAKFLSSFWLSKLLKRKWTNPKGQKQEKGCVYVAEEIISLFTKWSSFSLGA